jgi:hypothetical protein
MRIIEIGAIVDAEGTPVTGATLTGSAEELRALARHMFDTDVVVVPRDVYLGLKAEADAYRVMEHQPDTDEVDGPQGDRWICCVECGAGIDKPMGGTPYCIGCEPARLSEAAREIPHLAVESLANAIVQTDCELTDIIEAINEDARAAVEMGHGRTAEIKAARARGMASAREVLRRRCSEVLGA